MILRSLMPLVSDTKLFGAASEFLLLSNTSINSVNYPNNLALTYKNKNNFIFNLTQMVFCYSLLKEP